MRHPRLLAFFAASLLTLALAAGACDDDDPKKVEDPPYEQDPTKVVLRGACAEADRLGGFQVQMNETDGYTAVDGVVRDGVMPGTIPVVVAAEGGCRLLGRRNLFCDPSCTPGFTCGLDETCVPMPQGQDLGTVILRGLVERLELKALSPGNSYSHTRLPHPGYEFDHVIQARSAAGWLGPFELHGVGVTQLVPTANTWTLRRGEDLIIEWAPPPEGARSRIVIEINVDQHGLSPLVLSCNLPDLGSAAVPRAIVDALIDAGVTGFPTGKVIRRTEDSLTAAQGCVDFFVTSVRLIAIAVAGFTPCTRQEDCTPPEVCDTDPQVQQCYTPCDGPEDCTAPATCSPEGKCR